MTGEVGTDDGVLVIRRIEVRYRLHAPDAPPEVVERVRASHAGGCPVARTLRGCVDVETHVELG